MCTLFIDTHSSLITVALKKGNDLFKKEKESEASHSIYTLPMINELMESTNTSFKDIKNIVVVNGPGSFTGIRIGLSIVKTMAYSLNIPVYVISSLKSYLISSSGYKRKSVIEDNKGYYISIMDENDNVILDETYMTNIDEYADVIECPNVLDVEKIISYVLNESPVNVHSIKANYVKKIDLEK